MNEASQHRFTITDLKQYMYCPRICFYHTCLPDIRPVTAKMHLGIRAHEQEQKRAARRTLQQYHVHTGERQFDVGVASDSLRLSGQIDEVVSTSEGQFPVDYKLAHKAGFHFKVQLTAYALLLEETLGQPVPTGYLYLIPTREMIQVHFTHKLRTIVTEALDGMSRITRDEHLPNPTLYTARCVDCEFRRFCNDV